MPEEEKLTPWQWWQKLFTFGKIFLILVSIEAIVLFIINILMQTNDVDRCTTLPCRDQTNLFYSLSMYTLLIFLLYFGFSGIFNENMFEIFAFLATTIIIMLYGFMSIAGTATWYTQAILAIVIVWNVAYAFLCWKIYHEIGWYIYKRIGAHAHLRSMFQMTQVYVTMGKLDLMFSLILVILAGVYYLDPGNYEFYVTLFAFVLTFAWAALGFTAVTTENEVYINVYFALSVAEPAFIIYKLIKLTSSVQDLPIGIFALATIVELCVRSVLLWTAVLTRRNFGKGLLSEVFQHTSKKSRPLSPPKSAVPAAAEA
eukprot:TRINITY_DN3265_c0_g2_i1.p1 TRINITY_DN3265_c0_g2~~TRINITY_DN3265_c0_g2_i1.p1  ORF type:complete len:314 (+),score=80.57 TRINITY_DN3265_c0_g2_i1:92-1033(+)